MRPVIILAALAALTLATSAEPSFAQKIDKNGRCHDASGKFAKADVCKGAKATTGAAAETATRAPAATAAAPAKDPKGPYTLDAKGKCHDAKGKMASKSKCA